MATYRFLSLIIVWIAISCGHTDNGELKIYHLEPNDIIDRNDDIPGWYVKERHDFFAIKNFDVSSELHKLQVDSFVLDYIRDDDFLEKNKNASWKLTFFKYGDGITEDTKHEYNTDYTIHTLFSLQKEIGYYSFDTKKGYKETLFWIDATKDIYCNDKRKLIQEYFKHKGF